MIPFFDKIHYYKLLMHVLLLLRCVSILMMLTPYFIMDDFMLQVILIDAFLSWKCSHPLKFHTKSYVIVQFVAVDDWIQYCWCSWCIDDGVDMFVDDDGIYDDMFFIYFLQFDSPWLFIVKICIKHVCWCCGCMRIGSINLYYLFG